MKKLSLLVLSFGLVFTVTSFAANSKIGVVNFQDILRGSPEVAAASTKLKNQFEPQQKKLVAQQNDLEKMINKLKRDGAIMQAADRQKLEEQITNKRNTFVQASQKYQNEVMTAQQTAMAKIMKHINSVVAKIAQQDNVDLILARSSVAYVNNKLDLTKQVQAALK